jgi:RND family efflux transporter MFP subunit
MSIASRLHRRAFGPVSAVAVALVATSVLACGKGAAEPAVEAGEAVLTVGRENVYRVEPTLLASGPSISGSLEAERQATVAAEVPGPVLATSAEEGDTVAAGTVLARLDDSALREAVLSAQSAVRAADQQVEVARRNAERAEALLAGGAIPQRDVEMARWTVTNAQAGLADARARLTLAREQQGKTLVRAPFGGVVSRKSVSPGDTVQPGSPLYTVVDPQRMRLVAHVPADGIADLRPGTPVEFDVAGLPGQHFNGVVQRINPVVDASTRQVEIQVALPPIRKGVSSPASSPRAGWRAPPARRSPFPPRPSTARSASRRSSASTVIASSACRCSSASPTRMPRRWRSSRASPPATWS